MQLSLLKVRKLQPKDWEACWKIQRSLHTEPDENLFDAHTWSFICDVMSDSFVVADENDYAIAYWLGFLKVNDIEEITLEYSHLQKKIILLHKTL